MIAVQKSIHSTLFSPHISNAALQITLEHLIGHPGERTVSFLTPHRSFFFFFVICLFLLDRRRYNIKEVNLLITVYSLTTASNLTKSRKKREVTIYETLHGMSYIKQENSTNITRTTWKYLFTIHCLQSTIYGVLRLRRKKNRPKCRILQG